MSLMLFCVGFVAFAGSSSKSPSGCEGTGAPTCFKMMG